MTQEITTISPEGLQIANNYLELGNIQDVSQRLQISADKVVEILNTKHVQRYIDTIFLDMGYRNRVKIGDLLDTMIESKLEEARESESYTTKDLADLLQMAHKMRMDEIKAQKDAGVRNQTNVQINNESPFGDSNYGKLIENILNTPLAA